jgi:glucose-1-phosphate thymidylyltransferase
METIILSGGFAKRLLPISEFIPKPLLPLGGRPILDHIIAKVTGLGIDRIYLSVNKRFHDQFEYYASRRNDVRIEVIVEPTRSEEEKLGAIRGLGYALEHIQGKSYLVVAGDNYFDFNLIPMKDFFEKMGDTTVALYDIMSLEEARKYGVVSVDDHSKIIDFEEKPHRPKSTLISTGIYMFNEDLPSKIKKYMEEGNNPDQLGHLIKWMIKRDVVYGFPFKGKWYDIGSIEVYREVFNSFNK